VKSVSLTVNSIRVRHTYSKEYELLDQFSDQADDLHDVLRELLYECSTRERKSDESSQALQVTRLDPRGREIEGLIQAGSYGSESEIRRLGEWTDVRYQKGLEDVDLHPFYFLFDLPEGRERGYFILQSSGQDSVQTLVRKILFELFTARFRDLRLEFKPLVPDELLDKLKGDEARGSEIRFVRHKPPRDITSIIGRGGTDTTAGAVELVMKFKEDGFLLRAVERALQRGNRDGILELEDLKFPYDNVKIKVKLGGKERTVDLGQPGNLRPTVEITDQVRWQRGHPTFNSLSEAAHELLSQMKDRLEGRNVR
jgi:hypothetical protein